MASRSPRWQGFLFLNLAEQPMPLAEALAPLQGKFEPWRLPGCARCTRRLRGGGQLEALLPQLQRVLHCPNVHRTSTS
jgi:phenylpropionate dioxygenase-like ring-hydroxylating dioxygenase large terminal subunit